VNPYLSVDFLAYVLGGMGVFAWMGALAFQRMARYYGAQGLPPPPGSLRYLFRALLFLWLFLIGALAAALVVRFFPRALLLSSGGPSLTIGVLGALVAGYYLARGY
jgi:hypothetical protein